MKKLLLTCATRSFSVRMAQLLSSHFEVILATSDEVPHILAGRYQKIPKGANPTYAHEILKIALDLNCNYVLPLGIDEIGTLSVSLVLFEEYGIEVLCPNRTDLATLSVLDNPAKELALSLFIGGYDVLGATSESINFNGLGLLSDSGDSFILTVAK